MGQVSIVNVVGRLNFQRELKLSAVADLLQQSQYVSRVKYQPSENHWLQTWFKSPTSQKEQYVSFYRSGTAMITGCNSINEFQELSNRIIQAMDAVVEDRVLREVKNVVATATVGTTYDLSHLAILLGLDSVEYEPEQFPGLIYRLEKNNTVVLIFSSGKIVITGSKTSEMAENTFQQVSQQLRKILQESS